MKALLIGSIVFLLPLANQAQPNARIELNTGKTITIHSLAQTNTVVMMGLEIKSDVQTLSTIEVLEAGKDQLVLRHKLNRLQMNGSGMGQDFNYDSDKAQDRDSQIGQTIPSDLFNPDTILINRNSGLIISNSSNIKRTEGNSANPLENMMPNMDNGQLSGMATQAFYLLPANKKEGDQWMDSTINKETKTVTTYTLQSLTGDSATVAVKEVKTISGDVDANGMTITMNMTNTSTGIIVVHVNSGLVGRRETKSEVSGSMDTAGQSMPITADSKIQINFQ
ncbi:MAG TPA: DUF6263 family protein, partial [Ferruginibacter sp.]|nr:DUF6263 family protein [Ferruginibacter sp.]